MRIFVKIGLDQNVMLMSVHCRVALLPGNFLRVRKVFARPESFCAYDRDNHSKKLNFALLV